MREVILKGGWSLKERDAALDLRDDFAGAAGWLPATVPGTVHQDLLAAGRIPDPFVGLHEREVQWVGERDWLYRCAFELPPDLPGSDTAALCCDGLDTVATVWLNDREVLRGDNMFVPLRAVVTPLLRPGRNEIRILFESALRVGQGREAEHGRMAAWNGDPSRVYVRKAQYHWGWDWGPCLLTAGPWRPVRLEIYRRRIAGLHCPGRVAPDLGGATIPMSAELDLGGAEATRGDLRLRLELRGPEGERVDEALLPVEGAAVRHTFAVERPRLWWPRGYGEQPLYRVAATLEEGGVALDRRELRVGLRHLRLAQEPLAGAPGRGFVFVCNGVPVFCGGANWIPADSFLPRVTPERYRALVQQAADANMAMLRVWGGGVYEHDAFYDACDELGLLVWQDFMFACGTYPAYPAFQESVRAEAEAAVRRLRHHPCLALWCGNNEDYQVAESIRAYDPAFQGGLAASPFPGRALYERLLPEVCARLDPDRPYWPGSPYGGERTVNDPTVGDRHVWDVWHGSMAEYGQYARFAGRFVSEFGMQALPDPATIEAFAPPEERYGQSRTLEHHNKAGGGARRLAVYLVDTVRMPADVPGYVYATQLVQAEALGAAVRDWRRRWGGPGREAVAGAGGRGRGAGLAARRLLAGHQLVDRRLLRAPEARLLRHPARAGAGRGRHGARRRRRDRRLGAERAARYPPGGAGAARVGARRPAVRDGAPPRGASAQPCHRDRLPAASRGPACGARGAPAGRRRRPAGASLWPEPFKYLTLPDPEVEVARVDAEVLRVTARRPAKGVLLAAGDRVRWGDNMLDLQPDDAQTVEARGLGAEVGVRWLGAAAEVRRPV